MGSQRGWVSQEHTPSWCEIWARNPAFLLFFLSYACRSDQAVFVERFPCAYTIQALCSNLILMSMHRKHGYSHCTDEETKAYRDWKVCTGREFGFEPMLLTVTLSGLLVFVTVTWKAPNWNTVEVWSEVRGQTGCTILELLIKVCNGWNENDTAMGFALEGNRLKILQWANRSVKALS